MIGERYFSTRVRLAGVMRRISVLAADAKLSSQTNASALSVGTVPQNPFIFLVCGEVNAGKSAFINALFQTELCATSPLPETKQIRYYRYGSPASEVEISPGLSEIQRKEMALKSFQIIDTPGTDSATKDALTGLSAMWKTVDAVMVIFSVNNPWSVATWDFVSKIPLPAREKLLFVLQQVDRVGAQDVALVQGHVRDLILKRLGRELPVFPVSAHRAWTVQGSPSSRARSGFPELENFLSQEVCLSVQHRRGLECWRKTAAATLHTIDEQLDARSRFLQNQSRFLDDIEREIDDLRERFCVRLPGHLVKTAELFQRETMGVAEILRRRLGVPGSFWRLFFGDKIGQTTELLFVERLRVAVERAANKDAQEVAECCRQHWKQLIPRVQQSAGVALGTAECIEEVLAPAQQHFVQRIDTWARQSTSALQMRRQLDHDTRKRNSTLKSFVCMVLLLMICAGICGAFTHHWLALLFITISVVFAIGFLFNVWSTRRILAGDFQERLLATCEAVASTLRRDYEEALRIVFQDYASALGPVRIYLAKEKAAVHPYLDRWQELFLTLKALEQDL